MPLKKALVTGASGQDGFYLINLLHRHGYVVHAQSRRLPQPNRHQNETYWHVGDPADRDFLDSLISGVMPDEIYNLAAVSRPILSWGSPRETAEINALVPQEICELLLKHKPGCRLFQASSSEIFGDGTDRTQDERTSCVPKSPYGTAKLYAHRIIGAYRAQYGLHVSTGILFNHESPRRPLSFVSQKIAYAAAAVSLGLKQTSETDERGRPILLDGKIALGDLSVRRDFGFAGDYVEAMWLIVQHHTADDYVVGTGADHSIEEFCDQAFRLVGRKWTDHVNLDPKLIRKIDSHYTHADAAKIRATLNWRPKVAFNELVSMMVKAQIDSIQGRASSSAKPGVDHRIVER
ncbi:MAG: GDP-mannose 4,6-dehydratase [Afipia sp.]